MNKEIKWILVNNLWLVSLCFGFQRTVQAQNAPVITAATVLNAVPGQQVTIPITVSNFNNIGSTTLSLDYDPAKLQFVSATSNTLLGGSCNTGDNPIANGKHRLIMGWFNLSGKSLPDGSQIVKYVFTYLSGSPTLQWYDDGPSCNFTDPFLKKLNDIPTSTYYINGLVCGALPNTVSISGANAVHYGQSDTEYSVPLDPLLTYNWSYSGTGATIVGSSNSVMINFSSSATSGTLKVSASNTCNTSIGTKDIKMYSFIPPAFTTGPTNVNLHSSGNIYTVQPGMNNYSWTVKGGTITAGGTAADNSITITWNTAGTESVSVQFDNHGISTPVTLYPVTVNPAVLTITGITANKTYDGTNKATLNTVSAVLVGVFDPDLVTLNAVGATGTFGDKNVSTGKLVTTFGFTLSGPNAGNYIVISPKIIGDITPATVTISGIKADNKTYDGNTTATLNTGSALLAGIIGPDIVTLLTSGATGTFLDKNAGNAKTIITSGFSISGESAGNYTLIQPIVKANILPFASPLAITGVIANNKTYDGTTNAILNIGSARLVGIISTDTVTLNVHDATGTFADKNAATGKQVITTGFKIEGINAINYTLIQPTLTADITVATITVNNITANDKIYDGTNTTVLITGLAALIGVVSWDDVKFFSNEAIGTFTDKNVGSGKIVRPTGLFINGADAGNYTLINPLLSVNISPKPLIITAKSGSKCFGLMYNLPGVTYAVEGLMKNDTVINVTLTCNGIYPAAIAGTYDIVPETALGTGLSNYAITYVKGTLTVKPIASQPDEFLISTSTVCQGCVGVAYTVPNDPFVTYDWNYSGTGVTIHSNTNAVTLDFSPTATSGILSVTASTSCGTSVARTLPVTVDTFKSKPSIVFIDNSLFSNVGKSIQWYKNMVPIPGATSQNYIPLENGKYFNVVSNNCYSDTSNFINVIITNTTQFMNNTFQIFPNPTKEYFTLRSSDAMPEAMRLSIFSSDCILIKNYEITNRPVNRECLIDVRPLSSGLYFIRIDTGHKTITQKLIIL